MSKIIEINKKILSKKFQEFNNIFEKNINTSVDLSTEQIFAFLLKEYYLNCGISFGFRSVFWDFASMILDKLYPYADNPQIDFYAEKYITKKEWKKAKNYDAGLKHTEETIALALRMLYINEIQVSDLVLFSHLVNEFANSNDIDEKIYLYYIKLHFEHFFDTKQI